MASSLKRNWTLNGYPVYEGDEVRVLNSLRTRAFKATVVDGDDEIVTVVNHDKNDERQDFFADSGNPGDDWEGEGNPPRLASTSDPETVEIIARADAARPRARVNELVSLISRATRPDSQVEVSTDALDEMFYDLEEAVGQWAEMELDARRSAEA